MGLFPPVEMLTPVLHDLSLGSSLFMFIVNFWKLLLCYLDMSVSCKCLDCGYCTGLIASDWHEVQHLRLAALKH